MLANLERSRCHATASIRAHCLVRTGSTGIRACRTLTAPIDPTMETWPSGRRRSPAKGVDGEPSRGFESLRLRHVPLFLLHFSVMKQSVACPDGACGGAHDPDPASLPRSAGRRRRFPCRPEPSTNGMALKTSRMSGSHGRPVVPVLVATVNPTFVANENATVLACCFVRSRAALVMKSPRMERDSASGSGPRPGSSPRA